MPHFDDAIQYIQTNFPGDWATQFNTLITVDDPTNTQEVANLEVAVAAKLDNVAAVLYEQLNFSVLSGEYVTDLQGYRTKLDTLEGLIQMAGNLDIPLFPAMTIVAQEVFQSNFYITVRQTIKGYKSLLDIVDSHLVYQANTSTIMYVVRKDSDDSKVSNSAAEQQNKLFNINVELSHIDHTIAFSKDYFRDLLLLQDELQKLTSSNPVTEILLKKCQFLLYKISFRLKKEQKDYLYAIDFNFSKVQLHEVQDFSTFNAIIKGHYGKFSTSEYEQRRAHALLKFENNNPLDLNDYHALIKYFKDEIQVHDLGKLRKLRALYQAHVTQNSTTASKFDKKALDLTFCYLENNILSLELEKKEFNLQNWEAKLKVYTDAADQYKNKNFFPYFKIVEEFLLKEIPRQFSLKNYDLPLIQSLIDNYKENLTSLVENVGICEETDYLAFQNHYEGCKVRIFDSTGQQRECFIASSFVLPLNYKKINENLEQYKAELNKFKSMYAIQEIIDADRKDVRAVKQEIEKTDKRHIEILSIFAALVMFVSNEIQIFSKIPNMADAVAYTLFFAYGLGLFVVLIWFITRPEGFKFKSLSYSHKAIGAFFIAGFLAAILYVGIIKFSKNEHAQQLQDLQFKIDSLKKRNAIYT